MDMMILASICILALVVMIVAYKGLNRKQQSDSALRQRAVFNTYEHLTFTRLKEILPSYNVLAHVSFDALLTTKYPHTRRKYEKMFADFVVLDSELRVVAIVVIGEWISTKRSKAAHYQDALLEAADYKVLRYHDVPEYQQLRDDFLTEYSEMDILDQHEDESLGKYASYASAKTTKMRAFS